MTRDNVFMIIVLVGIAFIPALIAFDRLYRWYGYRNKKKKIAEFLEKSAEDQLKAKEISERQSDKRSN